MRTHRNKKGSQVGMILSFVIFVTFIFFLFIIIQPSLRYDRKDSSLDLLGNNLVEMASGNLTSTSISLSSSSSCVELTGFSSSTGIDDSLIVVDKNGNFITSGFSGGNLYVESGSEVFFRVYSSSEILGQTGTISGCQTLNEGAGYNVGIVKTSKDVLESRMLDLIENYRSDYVQLKDDLKVLDSEEFAFSFKYGNGTEISTTNQGFQLPTNEDIYAKNIPIVYINNQEGKQLGTLSVKIWG